MEAAAAFSLVAQGQSEEHNAGQAKEQYSHASGSWHSFKNRPNRPGNTKQDKDNAQPKT
jgi:hypothetical protein